MRTRSKLVVACAVLSAARFPAFGQGLDYHLERLTINGSGILNQPTYLTQAPGDPANVLFYSQRITSALSGFGSVNTMGQIFRYDATSGTSSVVLDLSSRNITNDDGLQTFTFNPDFNNATTSGYGKIYVADAAQGNTSLNRVEEFTVLNPDGSFKTPAQAFATDRIILQYNNSAQNNHTVDWVGFDPNATGAARNYLYISTGDGSYGNNYNGASGTNGRPAQNPSDDKGKILRVDISGEDDYDGTHTINGVLLPNDPNKNFAIPASNPLVVYNAAHPGSPITGPGNAAVDNEVYVTGVRNPYRVSFDTATSNMYWGNVGENMWESVDFLKAGTNTGAAPPVDYGWPQLEATHHSAIPGAPQTNVNPFTGATSLSPLQEYTHALGQAAIGGYVYNGPVASLQGEYIYADYVTGHIFGLKFDPGTDPSTFNGHNGTLTDLTTLWNSQVIDPNNPNYAPNITASNVNGIDHVVSFSQDNAGNLYIIDFGNGVGFNGQYTASAGEIFKVVPGALATPPATAVWTGGINNIWGDDLNAATTATNFNTSQTSGTNTNMLPGIVTDVVFSTTTPGSSNLSTILGRDFFINSLTIKSTSGAVTIANGTFGTSTLAINGAAGITVESGSGGLTISSDVWMGGDQTWTNAASTTLVMSGAINGPGKLSIVGNVSMGGVNTYTGGTVVNPASTLTLTNGVSLIGTVIVNGGTIIGNTASSQDIELGTTALGNYFGVITLNSGTITTAHELWLGTTTNGYGGLILNSGVVTTGSWLAVARGGGSGVLRVNGGTLNVNGNPLTVGSFGGGQAIMHAEATFTGGTTNVAKTLFAAEQSTASVNVMNNAIINVNGTTSFNGGIGLSLTGANATTGTTGIFNLIGGTITTTMVMKAGLAANGTTGIFNFNGGTLRAAATTPFAATFMSGITNAYIYPGGGFIDDNGLNITIAQPLRAPTGNGVGSIAIGTAPGFASPPLVGITGGGGTGATAIGNLDSTGTLTSLTVTNPGVGYTSLPTVTLSDQGGLVAPATTVVSLAPNSAGALTKLGAGTLNLTGLATYGGNLSINGGLLAFNTNSTVSNTVGVIFGAGGLQVAGASVLTSNGVRNSGSWTVIGRHNIAAGGGDAGTSKIFAVPAITHTGSGSTAIYTGVLNLADSKMIVQSTDPTDKAGKIGALNEAITAGAAGGTWTGNGLTSSSAAGDSAHYGVGVFDNAILGLTTFGGQSVDTNSILTAISHLGDANRNAIVDIQDLTIVANNWQQNRNNWAQGDLNRDGIVDIQDFTIVANNWQQTSSFTLQAGVSAAAAPEPASLALLALGFSPLLMRRKRRLS